MWLRAAVVTALMLVSPAQAWADEPRASLDRGDRAYVLRGAENDGQGRAEPRRIQNAIDAYEQALAENPEDLEARWKAMAALYFAGDFAASDEKAAHVFFERGRSLGEEGMSLLRQRLRLRRDLSGMDAAEIRSKVPADLSSDVGHLYFWAAINWGAWAREEGFLQIVTQGVARRLRDYARVSLTIDPSIYRGGNQRLLAHMHANLPRVPFVSGWVDRKKAVEFAEQAVAVQPEDLGNRAILGLVMLEVAPGRRTEALAILRDVSAATPRDELLVEDQATQVMVRERLQREEDG